MKSSNNKTVSLREIADACNVSRSTVSRALHGDPRIAKSTIAKVRKAASNLGYKPNPELEKLMSEVKKSQTRRLVGNLAFLWNQSSHLIKKEEKDFNRLLIKGAFERAEELGFSVDFINIFEKGITAKRLDQIILNRGIQGILIPPISEKGLNLDLDWSNVSVVSLTRMKETQRFHSVQAHTSRDVIRLFDLVVRKGYKRPGIVIHPDLENRRNTHTYTRYLQFCYDTFKINPLPALAPKKDSDFKAWISKYKPDVIIGPADWCYNTLTQNLGIKVPEEMGYAGYVDAQESNISGIIQRPYEIGRAGIELLTAHIIRSDRGIPDHTKNVHIESLIREGKTL